MTTNFAPTEIFNRDRLTQRDYDQFYEAIKLTGERVRLLYQTPFYSAYTNGELSYGVLPFSFFRGISIDEDYIIEQTGAVSDYNKVRDMDDGDVYGWAIDGKDERRLKYETVYPRSFFKRLKGLLSLQIEITNPGKVLPSINLQRLTKENVELQPKKAELIAMYSYDLNTRYGNYVPKGFIDINRGIANLMENERIRDNIHFSRRFLSD